MADERLPLKAKGATAADQQNESEGIRNFQSFSSNGDDSKQRNNQGSFLLSGVILAVLSVCGLTLFSSLPTTTRSSTGNDPLLDISRNDVTGPALRAGASSSTSGSAQLNILGKHHKKHHDVSTATSSSTNITNEKPGVPTKRCEWVVDLFTEKYAGNDEDELRKQYQVQSVDPNVFYRATANIFWYDFVKNGWHDKIKFKNIGINAVHLDGTPLQPRSTWTWVTGDQHLSNFGAWRNRGGYVVFSVNDFDEAAIYDFQVDVLRIAVSVCSHAYTNGLSERSVHEVLRAFTDMYVETLINYVGGDRELLFELTPETASGSLKTFLTDLKDGKSGKGLLEKFTETDSDGNRAFVYDDHTRLVTVPADVEQAIRDQFTRNNFGATMMHTGWHVRNWDDDYFTVLDVARRVGSGVGSYGVDRYYVLLKGKDSSFAEDGDGSAVILDVKFEPEGAVAGILTEEERAWYDVLFQSDAQRAVEAQRRLTSYVDPFTGWIKLDGKAFVVRQRSPWKDSPSLDSLTDPDDFIDFMEQVAVATATSHARGTAAKSPGQFKHVIASALGHWADRTAWGRAVAKTANEYRDQVLLDFQCFKDFIQREYPP